MTYKKMAAFVLLWMLWLFLTTLAFTLLQEVRQNFPTTSLRYEQPITEAAAINARRYCAKNSAPWPTFWNQSKETVSTWQNSKSAVCIRYSGKGNAILSPKFLSGDYPGELTQGAVCLSSELSWQLFGTYDTVTMTVIMDEKPYPVCGVFEQKEPIVMLSTGDDLSYAKWDAVQIDMDANADVYKQGVLYAKAAGLGAPVTVLDGNAAENWLIIFAIFPTIVLLFCFASKSFLCLWKKASGKRGLLLFVAALIVCAVLPPILSNIPPMLIPNKWSDFSFWNELLKLFALRLREWFALKPCFVDVQMKELVFKQICIFVLGLTDALLLCKSDAILQQVGCR